MVGIIFLNIVVKLHSALMFCFFLILGHNTIIRNIFLPVIYVNIMKALLLKMLIITEFYFRVFEIIIFYGISCCY